jgi:hypothetical protein
MKTDPTSRLARLRWSHERLSELMAELQQWCRWQGEAREPNYGEMGRRVMHFRDQVLSHMSVEEVEGDLALAAELRPELSREVTTVLEEHKTIRADLEELASHLSHGSAAFPSLNQPVRRLDEILERLRQHESAENHIFNAAFGGKG